MLPSRGSSSSEPELGKGSSPGPAAAVLGGWGSFQARSTEARTQQRKRVVRMGAVDLPAASGWTEQKSAWEVRPERQGGHVLEHYKAFYTFLLTFLFSCQYLFVGKKAQLSFDSNITCGNICMSPYYQNLKEN